MNLWGRGGENSQSHQLPVVDSTQPAPEPGLSTSGELETGIITYAGPDEVQLMGYLAHQHAFFNDTRTSYAADAAGDAWMRTLAWFDEYLRQEV